MNEFKKKNERIMKSDYYYKLGSFFIILYDESIKCTYIMEISDTIFLSFQ